MSDPLHNALDLFDGTDGSYLVDPEEARLVEEALACADSGSAAHWPTAAGILADEVRRLRRLAALRMTRALDAASDAQRARHTLRAIARIARGNS